MRGIEEAGTIRQVGALPYRRRDDGAIEVLLITSRDTRRWVIPKGNPITGLEPHQAAMQEAYEEAGILGTAAATSVGEYAYVKHYRVRPDRTLTVRVFPLAFERQLDEWPERHQREARWFAPEAAAAAVDEPALKALILRFGAEHA